MSKKLTTLESKMDWEHFHSIKDEDIDLDEIPEITPEEFAKATTSREFFAKRGIDFDPSKLRTARVHHEDGTVTEHWLPGHEPMVLLDFEVAKYFPTAEAVNAALKGLIELSRQIQHQAEPQLMT